MGAASPSDSSGGTTAVPPVPSPESPARVPLSPFENLWCQMHDLYDGDGIGAIVTRIRGCIEEEPLRTALSRLQQRHPKLRARVVILKDGRRYFEVPSAAPAIPLTIVDFDTGPAPWLPETYRILSARMDTATAPLARMLLLRNRREGACHLSFIAHHAIMDATSMVRIVDDLLEFHREVEAGGTLAPVVPRPLFSVPRATVTGSWRQRLAVLIRMGRNRASKRRGQWITLPEDKQAGACPRWERHVFTEEETRALAERCREERSTTGSALYAAAICALADVVPQKRIRVRCALPFSMRSLLTGPEGPVTSQDLGCFIGGYDVETVMPDGAPPFWDIGREVWRDIEAFIKASAPQILYNILPFIKFSKNRRLPKRDTLSVNYLGVARVRGQYGRLSLEECMTLAKGSHVGPSLNVWAMTTRGRLCVWLGCGDVQAEFTDRYWQAVLKQLRGAMAPRAP